MNTRSTVLPYPSLQRVAAVAVCAWVLFAVQHGLAGGRIAPVSDLLVALASLFTMTHVIEKPHLRAHLFMAANWAGLFIVATVSGQSASPTLWWLAAVPLVAAYLLDRNGSYAWAAVSTLSIAVIHVSARLAPFPAEFIHRDSAIVFSQCAFVCVLFIIAEQVRTVSDSRLDEAQTAQRSAVDLARHLRKSNLELDASRARAVKEVAERANFTAAVSHEIRTPLNGIIGMAQLLRDERDPARSRQYSHELFQAGHTLLRLVNNVLDYSKTRSGAIEFSTHAFQLEQVIEDAIQLYAAQAWSANIDLAHIPGRNVPNRVVGDASAVQQIVTNLVGNALRYTETGQVRVTTRLSRSSHVVIEVSDTGCGIAPERVTSIWEPWVRGQEDRVGGTGLGLALVKGLVDSLGGTVEVKSTVGEGSTFSVTVPLDLSSTVVPESDRLPKRALIAIDRDASGDAFAARCERWGIQFTRATNKVDMVASLNNEPFDVLICMASWQHLLHGIDTPPTLLFNPAPRDTRDDTSTDILIAPVRSDILRLALHRTTGAQTTHPEHPMFDTELAKRVPLDILVVEDNPTNQMVMTLILGRLGYEPIVVGDGLAAVEASRKHAFDLILMDRSMPVMDGLTSSQEILKRRPSTRIVLVSAGYDEEQHAQCLSIGVREFLDKPVELSALQAVLNNTTSKTPPAPDKTITAAIDVLLMLSSDDVDSLKKLVNVWIRSTHDQQRKLHAGWSTGNIGEVQRAAHTIRGAGGTYGAVDVSKTAATVEHLSQGPRDDTRLKVAISQLDAAIFQAIESIQAEVNRRG